MKRLALLVVLLGGCAGSSSPPPAQPVAAADAVPTCEAVAEHMIDLVFSTPDFKNSSREERQQVAERLENEKLRAIVRCSDAAEPVNAELRRCVLAATSLGRAKACDQAPAAPAPNAPAPDARYTSAQ